MWLRLLVIVVSLVWAGPALTDEGKTLPSGFEGLEQELGGRGLVAVAADIPVLASPSAADRGRPFAAAIRKASGFFDKTLGWRSDFRLVVLNREDWAKIATVPYPAPHVWNRERLVVMPDTLAAFPGFEVWGFDDLRLNEALTVHEIGHALVHAHGIRWDQIDHGMNELLANVMMAAFIRAEMPDMMRLLEGAPAGFDPPGTRSLADFDHFYVGVGLARYAWFQFELARAAGVLTESLPLAILMPRLIGTLDQAHHELPEHQAKRLEAVVPGVGRALSAFNLESSLPEIALGPCEAMTDPPGPPRASILIIENRSERTVTLRDLRAEREIALFNDLPPDQAEAIPVAIAPGRWYRIDQLAGIDILIDGGRCARIGEQPSRLMVRE